MPPASPEPALTYDSPAETASVENLAGSENVTARAALRTRVFFAARLIIATLLVWWLIKTGRFVPQTMLQVHSPLALAGAILCQMVVIGGVALRWPLVLRARNLEMPLGAALRLGLAAQFAAVWTPAGLGMDGARALDGTRRFPGRKADVFKAAALDRVCALVALLLICAPGGLWLLTRGNAGAGSSIVRTVGGLASFSVMYFAVVAGVGFALSWNPKTRPWCAPFLIAFAVHAANAAATVLCFAAQGGRVTAEGLVFAAPLVVLSSIIPLTPLGIGVVDTAAAEVFKLALMPGAAAATMLARATGMALSLACGALALHKTAEKS